MNNRLASFLSLVIVISLFPVRPVCAQDSYEYKTYENNTGEIVNRFWLQIDELDKGRIKADFKKVEGDRTEIEEYVLDVQFATIWWKVECKQDDTLYEGERIGDQLVLKGKFMSESIDKVIDIGKEPLFVNPKLGLMGFVRSKKKSEIFWALRNDNLEVFKMMAKNQGEEVIKLNDKEVTTNKVYWAPKGFGSMFFNRIYWFRSSDNLYVRQTTSKVRMRELVK